MYGAKAGRIYRAVAAFREDDPYTTPASAYAATKRMNELQLSTCTAICLGLGVFALHFFTVYGGPHAHPDIASKFTHAIARGQPITLFADGKSRPRPERSSRTSSPGVIAAIDASSPARYEIFNLGGNGDDPRAARRSAIIANKGARGSASPATIDWQPDQPGRRSGDLREHRSRARKARLVAAIDASRTSASRATFRDWLGARGGRRLPGVSSAARASSGRPHGCSRPAEQRVVTRIAARKAWRSRGAAARAIHYGERKRVAAPAAAATYAVRREARSRRRAARGCSASRQGRSR